MWLGALYVGFWGGEASEIKCLTSLPFNQLPLTSVVVGSNPAHDNMWDSQRACPDINQLDLLPLTSVVVCSHPAHDNMWDSQGVS